jgi:hypothetical protein
MRPCSPRPRSVGRDGSAIVTSNCIRSVSADAIIGGAGRSPGVGDG